MKRAGSPYEQAVADIARQFDGSPTVETNVLVDGPDGRRELDVTVSGTIQGLARRVFIECRDYNPERGPLGIAHVDGLESKHRDLKFDACFLCSNAGFTADAIRKASRYGIALIGALRIGDTRIKYAVHTEMFVRFVTVSSFGGTFNYLGSRFDDVADQVPSFEGESVADWLRTRFRWYLIQNVENHSGPRQFALDFRAPVPMTLGQHSVQVTGFVLNGAVESQWYSRVAEIDTTSGVYDWIERRLKPNNLTEFKVEYRKMNLEPGGDHPCDPPTAIQRDYELRVTSFSGLTSPSEKHALDAFLK